MKKYIFSVLMAAMAAFTFSSCEDVPEPYTQPVKPAEPGTTTEGNPSGTGTAADPFNCAAAVQYCNSLESGVESTEDVYVKGKVQSIEEQYSANYGNCSVTLYDEDSNVTFKIWRAYYFDNKKWTSDGKTINVGDVLVFCGKVVNYAGNTPETVQSKAYLYSINGETSGNGGSDTPGVGEAKGTGTAADPFNSVAANNFTKALEAGKATDQEYYIKGKIQSIKDAFNAQYGNASFYIADDANSDQFYVFRIYYFGGEKWKEGDGELKVGDEVVVCAKLINYMGNTPETNQGGKLISVNGKTSIDGGGSTPDTPDTPVTDGVNIDGTTVTLNNSAATAGSSVTVDFSTFGYENQQAVEKVSLEDGTTISFDANGETNGPKYYTATKGFRVYKNNKITFTGKSNIAKIVMNCDAYNGTNYVGNETATVTFSGKTAVYTNTFTGTSGGGVQLRVKTLEIFYAK